MSKISIFLMIWYWIKYWFIQLLHLILSLLSYILFPLAYFFRFKLKWDLFWVLLNDETINGEQWWLDKHNLKPGFWTAWRWNIRNSGWNGKKLIKPKWKAGETQARKTIKNTLPGFFDWANRADGPYGFNFCYYIIDNTIECRFTFANKWIEIQLGSGGEWYRFRTKPILMYLPILIGIGYWVYTIYFKA